MFWRRFCQVNLFHALNLGQGAVTDACWKVCDACWRRACWKRVSCLVVHCAVLDLLQLYLHWFHPCFALHTARARLTSSILEESSLRWPPVRGGCHYCANGSAHRAVSRQIACQ